MSESEPSEIIDRRMMVEGAVAQNDRRLMLLQQQTFIGPDGQLQRVQIDPNALLSIKLGALVEHLFGDMEQTNRLNFETILIDLMDQFLDSAEKMLAEQQRKSGLITPGAGVDVGALARQFGNGRP